MAATRSGNYSGHVLYVIQISNARWGHGLVSSIDTLAISTTSPPSLSSMKSAVSNLAPSLACSDHGHADLSAVVQGRSDSVGVASLETNDRRGTMYSRSDLTKYNPQIAHRIY